MDSPNTSRDEVQDNQATPQETAEMIMELNQPPNESAMALCHALHMLPTIINTLPFPATLATNVRLEDFITITSEFEDIKHLAFREGVVLIEELPSGAHERVVQVIGDHIRRAVDQVFGRRCVEELGSVMLAYDNSVVQPDTSFRPFYPGNGSATLLIQVLDSVDLATERSRAAAILSAPNNVHAILLIKLVRYIRAPVPAVAGGTAVRLVGQHQFSDPGFGGDPAPAVNETAPVSEMVYVLIRRGVAEPIISTSGLGAAPPGYVLEPVNDVAVLWPEVPVRGGNPGPFIPKNAANMIIIPWADIFHVSPGLALPPNIVAILENLAVVGSGIVLDPFEIWADLNVDTRFILYYV